MSFPPLVRYPNEIDDDYSLYLVYNTTESVLSEKNLAWSEEISIVPVTDNEIWANNGFATIEGELLYYDAVGKDVHGKVNKLKKCLRNIGGKKTKTNLEGTWIRGFVVAEHHNQLASVVLNIEDFIGENFTEDEETLDWRIRNLAAQDPIFNDFACPDVVFSFNIISVENTGTTAQYQVLTNGLVGSVEVQFGDGITSNLSSGTHLYAPNASIDPVAIVTNDDCQIVQTPINRSRSEEPEVKTKVPPFTIDVPNTPVLPEFVFPSLAIPSIDFNIPPIVLPCLDLSPLTDVLASFSLDFQFPSIDINVPSVITFTPNLDIPSLITFIPNLDIPSEIAFINIPTFDDINISFDFPSIIFPTFAFPDIIFPSINFPSIISFEDIPNIPTLIEFENAPTFSNVEFGDPPTFDDIGFEDAPTFTDIGFEDTPVIDDIGFEPAPTFTDIGFESPPTFPDIGFENPPTFSDIGFENPPTFPDIGFENPPTFTDIGFETPPAFDDVQFGTPPTFSPIEYGTPPAFDCIEFCDPPTFADIGFDLPPVFDLIEFDNPPTFSKISFDNPPMISVDWGSAPVLSCVLTCPTPSSMSYRGNNNNYSAAKRQDFDDEFDSIELQYDMLGFPSQIEVIAPKSIPIEFPKEMPKFEFDVKVHGIPDVIVLDAPKSIGLDVSDVKIPLFFDGPPISAELKVNWGFDQIETEEGTPCFHIVPCRK